MSSIDDIKTTLAALSDAVAAGKDEVRSTRALARDSFPSAHSRRFRLHPSSKP